MVIVLLEYIDLFLRLAVLQVRIFSILKIIIPIMLALCLMLSGTYYAKNYAGIIGRGLKVAGHDHRFAHASNLNVSCLSAPNRNGWIVIIVYAITRTTVARCTKRYNSD